MPAAAWHLSRTGKCEAMNVIKRSINSLLQRVRAMRLRGNNVRCPVCGGSFVRFLPMGVVQREGALCPGCGSLERHRLLWLAFGKLGVLEKGGSMLHVAPEAAIAKKLSRAFEYISVDLDGDNAMMAMDIRDLRFPDGRFDLVVCNHVLEHVKEDRKAIAELFRVLKPGGYGSIQVPMKGEETEEDDSVTDPREREKLYGLSEHVRWYGRTDFKRRLAQAGFEVMEIPKQDLASPADLERLSVACEESVILVRKP